jgi:hypothetical protein
VVRPSDLVPKFDGRLELPVRVLTRDDDLLVLCEGDGRLGRARRRDEETLVTPGVFSC